MNLLDKLSKHPLGDFEICDNAVLHRPDGSYIPMRSAKHFLCLLANGHDFLGVPIERDDGWLIQHNSFSPHVNQCVGCTEVYSKVCG